MRDTSAHTQYQGSLSPFIAREEVQKLAGGVSTQTLARCDFMGIGPKSRMFVGKTCFYETSELCKWLANRRN